MFARHETGETTSREGPVIPAKGSYRIRRTMQNNSSINQSRVPPFRQSSEFLVTPGNVGEKFQYPKLNLIVRLKGQKRYSRST